MLAMLCCMVGVSGSESGSLRGRPRGQGYVRQHQKIQRETRFSGAPCETRAGGLRAHDEIQGFRAYYLLAGGPDVLITVSIFDSADEAFASNEKAADWVRDNVLEFTKGMPEVMIGNSLIAEVK